MLLERNAQTWISSLPKIELHLHLEGAIPLPALQQLTQKYNRSNKPLPLEALTERFQYKDFAHFIETWIWKNSFIQEYEDFTFIAQAVAADLVQQGHMYAEMYCSPADFFRHGLHCQRILEAIRQGLDRIEGIQIFLIPDLIRDFGPTVGEKLVLEIAEVREQLGILGIGLGGSEKEYPPSPYRTVYKLARTKGLRTTAHAGEIMGPDRIWETMDSLQVDRIGHGTSAIEDSRLLDQLQENQTPIEMCPISNLCTQSVQSLASHPIIPLYKRGLNVSVHTDDPAMFQTSMKREFESLIELGLEPFDIMQLTKNAIRSAWCDDSLKEAMLAKLDAYPTINEPN